MGRTFTRCLVTVGLKHFRLREQGMVINPSCLLPQNKEDREDNYEELGDIFITLHGGIVNTSMANGDITHDSRSMNQQRTT